jgi:hypothetical protein
MEPVAPAHGRPARGASTAYTGTAVSNNGNRPTPPTDLSALARELEGEFEQSSSDIRPLMPLNAVPWFKSTLDQVKALPLDPRAGMLISLMDGKCTVEMILDMSGIREDDAIDILARMMELGVIELRDAMGGQPDTHAMGKFMLPDGPFPFSLLSVDQHVEPNRIGAYVLQGPGERKGDLVIARVGRSDTDLNRRLKAYLTNFPYTADARYYAITHFSFGYLETKASAFETECVLFHDWEPPLNDHHPGRPRGSIRGCPVVDEDDCLPSVDED